LQLSGIGPGDLLQSLNIPVIADRRQTGENLQDHLQIRSVYKTCQPITLNDELASPWQKLRAATEYAMTRSGPLSMAASQVYAFCRTRLANERPDIQYHFQPLSADSPGEGLHDFPAVTASVCQLRPESRGSIQIVSPDIRQHPRIVTNYLSTDLDCRTAIEALRFTRRIMQGEAMRKHIAEELLPDPAAQSDDALLEQARNIANTIYHPTSTCRMGTDTEAVVNPRLQVNGVEGLRVVDASIMPEIVSGNTNAPTVMIGEKAADMIIEDQR
jgi:choline dehydrogenase